MAQDPDTGTFEGISTPYAPDVIGPVAGRTDIPPMELARKPAAVQPPPPQAPGVSEATVGIIYLPYADQPGSDDIAGQCDYCGCWYFWPVASADHVSLLQCASCYHLYRPASS